MNPPTPRAARTSRPAHAAGHRRSASTSRAPARIPSGRDLATLGLRPRKGLGQHFLVAPRVLERIADAAEIVPGDTVVEVGPGLGALTDLLAARAGRVVALELDMALAAALQSRYTGRPNVAVVQGDALRIPLDDLVPPGQPYTLVGNLPYYAATAIVRRFLEAQHGPERIVAMLQREVAQEMTAPDGKRGLLGVATQFYGAPRIVAVVRPGSFLPPPKVTSAVVRIDLHREPPVRVPSAAAFFAVARAGFAAPRKQLRNGLSHALGRPPDAVAAALTACAIDPARRPETLTMDEWAALTRAAAEAGWVS